MKKRINLLLKKRDSTIAPVVSEKVNLIGTILGIVLFLVFLVSTILLLQLQGQTKALAAERDNLSNYILTNKEEIAKMNFYSHKNTQLKEFLKDDAEFLPYYNLLKDAIEATGDEVNKPELDYMKIDKSKATEFIVRFDTYEPAYKFLKSMETESFLSNFVELKLTGFLLNETATVDKKGYELQFTGNFKPIN